jgi:hypothetical protein
VCVLPSLYHERGAVCLTTPARSCEKEFTHA